MKEKVDGNFYKQFHCTAGTHPLTRLYSLSVMQGGSGLPFMAIPVYSYITCGKFTNIEVGELVKNCTINLLPNHDDHSGRACPMSCLVDNPSAPKKND